MEGFFPIFSLILFNPIIYCGTIKKWNSAALQPTNQRRRQKMNSLKNVYELIDMRGWGRNSGTRLYAPSSWNYLQLQGNTTSVPFIGRSAAADEEECFDISTDSLESSCKRLRLNSSLESIEPETYAPRQNEDLPDSPESPDESMCSDIFDVEESPDNAESLTSSRVAEYLERVQQKDSASYFITPPGSPRKISFNPASPLNNFEEKSSIGGSEDLETRLPSLTFMPRQPGRSAFPREVALSQPAPGLDRHCKRVGIGRGHGCSLRFPRWYFGY